MAHRWWPPGSVFRYVARDRRKAQLLGMAIYSPEMLAEVCTLQDAAGRDSYWQINPTNKEDGSRCSTEDITGWSWFPLDVDPAEDGGYAAADKLLARVLTALCGYVNDPVVATIIFSGRGAQALIPVAGGTVGPSPIPLDEAPTVMSHWLQRLSREVKSERAHLDTAVSDLPRIMRMPYTINSKTGVRADLCDEALESSPWLAQRLRELMPEVKFQVPTAEQTETQWPLLLPRLTAIARRYLTEGVSYPSRHKSAFATLASLIEANATEAACLAALLHGAALCDPQLEPEEVVAMVQRKFRKISA